MKITPFVVGSGRAADAIKKSLASLSITETEFQINSPIPLKRGQSIEGLSKNIECPVLIIANPHGLHAKLILEAEKENFKLIVVEKPAAVSLDEVTKLKNIKTPVAVCHVYRQMWGIQTLKKMALAREFGNIVSIEGKYWQSSTAQKALQPEKLSQSWKNDPSLGGLYDVLIDIGTHWFDSALYLASDWPQTTSLWLSTANAETPHRDSHVHLNSTLKNGTRLLASISKNVHGATNEFEMTIIGTQKSATWNFLNPDEIKIGQGNSREIICRSHNQLGSHQPPFHGLGWIEGYIEILRQSFSSITNQPGHYPALKEHLQMLEALFTAQTERN